jgi:hypothetical protein
MKSSSANSSKADYKSILRGLLDIRDFRNFSALYPSVLDRNSGNPLFSLAEGDISELNVHANPVTLRRLST